MSRTVSFGAYVALKTVADQVGSLAALQNAFPQLWEKIFAAAMHALCAETTRAQDFRFWFFRNYCSLARPIVSNQMSEFCEKIAEEPEAIAEFMRSFHSEYYRQTTRDGSPMPGV